MPKKLIKKRIFVEKKKIKALMAETDSVESTIFQALGYNFNSEKAIEIRRLAVEQYGGVMLESYTRPVKQEEIINQFM